MYALDSNNRYHNRLIDAVKAEVRAAVKRVLRMREVRPEHFDFLIDRIMEQAAALHADWPLGGVTSIGDANIKYFLALLTHSPGALYLNSPPSRPPNSHAPHAVT
ncbi:MAG: hypothetical protein ABSC05_05020 [Candidatus Solibacter sp.]